MKLTAKKLRQIIREEVERATEAFNYGPDGKPTPAQQKWRSRERNVGVADSERRAASRAARRGTQITDEEKKAISSLIDQFLAKVNDENSGWWPQTWLGGGRIYDPSSKKADKDGYYDRPPEQNAAMRKRFDDLRAASGRDPFTVDHIKQDIAQSGSSVWYSEDGQLKHPSLSSFIKSKLIKAVSKKLDAAGMEGEEKLRAYLKGL